MRRQLFFIIIASLILVVSFFLAITFFYFRVSQNYVSEPKFTSHLFPVQSIDTMKSSRDRARQILGSPNSFKSVIDEQMTLISDAGATHVAIATPYDAEFSPVLKLWVTSAREHHLSVWFRGNFSGWEGWFDYQKINQAEHKILLTNFLARNSELFDNNDIFTPCTECENGGAGDPRITGDIHGYNNFLIEEKQIADNAFFLQNKHITVYPTMNADIANEIISAETVQAFDNSLLVDHYVRTPEQFLSDIQSIGKKLNAEIGLGEFGAPILDLNGEMTQTQQAKYVDKLFIGMYQMNTKIPIVNYWDLSGGSTALINEDGTPRSVYKVVQNYFKAVRVRGVVKSSLGENIPTATVSVKGSSFSVKTNGSYQIFVPRQYHEITIEADGYIPGKLLIPTSATTTSMHHDFYLEPMRPSYVYKFKAFLSKFNWIFGN